MLTLASLCIMLSGGAAASHAPAPAVQAPAADSAWDEADLLASQGRHREAAAAYERVWEHERAPAALYSWAQASRLSGDCEAAVEQYRRFLAEGEEPPASYDTATLQKQWQQMLDNAAEQRDFCIEQIGVPPGGGVVPPPAAGVETGPADTASQDLPPDARNPEPPTAGDDEHPNGKRLGPDPAGWVLIGVGAATAVTGVLLTGLAAARDGRASQGGPTHDDFLADIRGARIEQTVGFVALGVGAALVVGGAVRLAMVRKNRNSRRAHRHFSPVTAVGHVGLRF